jgi:hypothetical protein
VDLKVQVHGEVDLYSAKYRYIPLIV